MTSVLLFGFAVMLLLGAISGRRTGTICNADSYCSVNTWVWMRSPSARILSRGPSVGLWYSLASLSGTMRIRLPFSTTAYPCRRRADRNTSYTDERGIGFAETMLIVPLTRGSIMKFFRVISLTAFTTPSISALTKLSVTPSRLASGAGTARWMLSASSGAATDAGTGPASADETAAKTQKNMDGRQQCRMSLASRIMSGQRPNVLLVGIRYNALGKCVALRWRTCFGRGIHLRPHEYFPRFVALQDNMAGTYFRKPDTGCDVFAFPHGKDFLSVQLYDRITPTAT